VSELRSRTNYVICPQVSDITQVLSQIFSKKLNPLNQLVLKLEAVIYLFQLLYFVIGAERVDQLLACVL
jgi:hypothetical protein